MGRPRPGVPATAGFGDDGLWASVHTGQDFAAPDGTPMRAIGDGKIVLAAYDGSYGNKMAILHADGTLTWYAHLSAYVQASGSGDGGRRDRPDRVDRQHDGPHLHLEVRPGGGDPVPPLTWLREHGVQV